MQLASAEKENTGEITVLFLFFVRGDKEETYRGAGQARNKSFLLFE